MYKSQKISLLVLFIATALSLQAQVKITPAEYIEKFAAIAVEEMNRTGIPASITLGQGLLETGSGNSRLAREANNHFGIKCKKTWTGKTFIEDDDEKNECFRAYDSPEESYRDHSAFLMQNSRYAFLFDLDPKDYKGWAKGLKTAGYATNPRYPEMLISTIEKHELHKYDEGKVPEKPIASTKEPVKNEPLKKDSAKKEDPLTAKPNEIFKYNKIAAVQIHKGQTAASVSKQFGMRPWQIYKYNDLEKGSDLIPGSIIYLKPKKRKGSAAYHRVKANETMYDISQQYGIKLNQLYKKNHMAAGKQPAVGEVLYMRKKANNPPLLREETEVVKTQVQIQPLKDSVVKKDQAPKDKVVEDTAKNLDQNFVIVNNETKSENDTKEIASFEQKKNDSSFQVKITQENKELPVDKDKLDKVDFHIVKQGETLFGIAKQYGKSVELIKLLNKLSSYQLSIGQKLIIEGNYKESKPDVATTSFYHTVSKGQTLYAISRMYSLTVDEIKQMNNLSSDVISEGQRLYVYKAPKNSESKDTETLNYEYHEVTSGETLYSISRKHGISVDKLKELNQLTDNIVKPGQRLRVK